MRVRLYDPEAAPGTERWVVVYDDSGITAFGPATHAEAASWVRGHQEGMRDGRFEEMRAQAALALSKLSPDEIRDLAEQEAYEHHRDDLILGSESPQEAARGRSGHA